jgi:hypothetical protein
LVEVGSSLRSVTVTSGCALVIAETRVSTGISIATGGMRNAGDIRMHAVLSINSLTGIPVKAIRWKNNMPTWLLSSLSVGSLMLGGI